MEGYHSSLCFFRGIARCDLLSRIIVLFWDDMWNGQIRSNSYPSLCTHAINKVESVVATCSKPLEDSFKLPLTSEIYMEFLQLRGNLIVQLYPISKGIIGASFGTETPTPQKAFTS